MSVWGIYARVSTEEQVKFGASLSSQVEAARQRALELGATEVVEYVDQGVPGDVLVRPGLSALRDALASRSLTGVVVYDPDRLARNLSHQLLLTEEVQNAGVRLEFVNFEWKDTDEGRLFYSIRGAIAEYEKAKIRERTTRGKWAKVKQGFSPNGRVPYGYVFDKLARTVKINEETAVHLRNIFSWFTEEGIGPYSICARLNSLGVPTPQKGKLWVSNSIRKILSNPAYLGQQIVHRIDAEGAHRNPHLPKSQRKTPKERPPEQWMTIPIPRLIDDQMWERAQEQLEDLRRKFCGRPGRYFFLLQRLAACGICEATLYGIQNNGRRNNRYYRCTSEILAIRGMRPSKCSLPLMPAGRVEELTWQQVVKWASNPKYHYDALERAAASLKPKATGPEFRHMENRLEELKKERTQLNALVAKGLVKQEHVGPAIRDLSQQIDTLEQDVDRIRVDLALRPNWTPESIEPTTEEELEAYTPEKKKALVRRYIERVFIYPDGQLRVLPRLNPFVVN